MSEPPDRPVLLDDDELRRAQSASAVLMMAGQHQNEQGRQETVNNTATGMTSDVLSGFGSTTSKESTPEFQPESLEDALSLDEDSEGSEMIKSNNTAVLLAGPPPEGIITPLSNMAAGFLLPRSPARLFVHNSVIQSAFQQLTSTSSISHSSSVDNPAESSSSDQLLQNEPESSPPMMDIITVIEQQVDVLPELTDDTHPPEDHHRDELLSPDSTANNNTNLDSGVCDEIPVHQRPESSTDDGSLMLDSSFSGGYHTPSQPLVVQPPPPEPSVQVGESFITRAAFLFQEPAIHLSWPFCLACPVHS